MDFHGLRVRDARLMSAYLAAITEHVAQLKFDREMALVRGNYFVADLYKKQMEQIYEPLQEAASAIWLIIGAVRWGVDPREFDW